MGSGHCQESHLLVTAVGWDSPPTHRRAVNKHVDAAGDVVHGSFGTLRASRIGYRQNYLVRWGVRVGGHTTHRQTGFPPSWSRGATQAESRQHRQPPIAGGAVGGDHLVVVFHSRGA